MDMNENYDPEPIDFTHDQLVGFISDRNREDGERASSAGESRQKIGEFLETTGLNGQALSVARSILKKKKYSQKMDVIRSLEELLPEIKAHVIGQSGPDMFEKADRKDKDQPVDFADPDADPISEEVDEETAEFNAEVEQVTDADGNVVAFGETA